MDHLRNVCERAMNVGTQIDLTGCFYEIAGPFAFQPCGYYPLLAGLVRTLGMTQVLDVGTRFGGSILAASRGLAHGRAERSVLVTVDLVDEPGHDLGQHPEIVRVLGDAATRDTIDQVVRHFRPPIDLLYLDAVHTLEHTRACFDAYTTRLDPRVVVVDDIHLNPSMQRFWEELHARFPAEQLYDATELVGRGAECGFGVVSLRTQSGAAPSPIGAKSRQWRHYYDHLIERARRDGVTTAEAIDDGWADPRQMASDVLPYLDSNAVVLEIACGVGRVSRFVAPHCGRLYCADILPGALDEAKAALAHLTNVSFHETTGYDLREFEPGMFDVVFSFTSFFHFDLELVLQYFGEIARVLKAGGVAIIEFKKLSEPHELEQLVTAIESHGGITSYEAMLDKWRYVSIETLALLCRHYGLEIVNDDVTRFTCRKPASPDAVV